MMSVKAMEDDLTFHGGASKCLCKCESASTNRLRQLKVLRYWGTNERCRAGSGLELIMELSGFGSVNGK